MILAVVRSITVLLALCLPTLAMAEHIRFLVAFPPGNYADLATRSIAQHIEKRHPGTQVTVLNRPGADTILASNEFTTNTGAYDLMAISTTQVIVNPLLNPGQVRYSVDDMEFVGIFTHLYAKWISAAGSGLPRQPQQLLSNMPPVVGGFAAGYYLNHTILVNQHNLNSQVVLYRGVNEVVTDLLNGTLPMALIPVNAATWQHVRSGRLHVIGTTAPIDLTWEGTKIISVSKLYNTASVGALWGVIVQPTIAPDRRERIRNMVLAAVQDPDVQQVLTSSGAVLETRLSTNSAAKDWVKQQQTRFAPVVQTLRRQ